MLLYHVLTQPHVCTIAPPPELRPLFPLHLRISEHLLYLNPLYLSVQSNLIISFHTPLSLFISLPVNPSNPFPISPASDLRFEIIGHTASRTSGRNT